MDDATWSDLYGRFDPALPARGATRVDRTRWSPIGGIERALRRPGTVERYLLLGSPGSGKTTELLRLAEDQAQRRLVVSLDIYRHFHDQVKNAGAIDRVEAWEVVTVVALALLRVAGELLPPEVVGPRCKALQDALTALQEAPDETPQLDVGKLAGAVIVLASAGAGTLLAGPSGATAGGAVGQAVAGPGVLGAVKEAGAGLKELAASVKWAFPLGRGAPKADEDAPVLDLVNATNGLIGDLQGRYKPLLIVLDGLDRMTDPVQVERVFVTSSLLGQLQARTVLTAPLLLERRRLAQRVRDFKPARIENIPVLDDKDPREPGPGVPFFVEVARKRGLGRDVATDEQIQELARGSGGVVRAFLTLVQQALAGVYDRSLDHMDAAAVTEALREHRQQLEMGITREDVDLLTRVADDPLHELPDEDRAADLLVAYNLLPFPNGTTWYHPHPLLMHLVNRRRPGSIA